jgi:hypothetical protein
MKFLKLLVLLFTLATIKGQAQLPYPSVAPNFTLTDVNGVQHDLYSYLDQGYQVILHIDGAWNQVGWNYINTGWLQSIHNDYGVQSGGNVIVLFVETDPDTNLNTLYGNGGSSAGNWVANTPYPVIHNESGSLNSLYNVAYYPTIYSICPNRIVREIGQPNLETLTQIVQGECAPVAEIDPMILAYTGPTAVCNTGTPSVMLYNAGNTTLTNGSFILSGIINEEILWSGNIPPFGTQEVSMGEFQFSSNELTITFNTANDQNPNNNSVQQIILSSTTPISGTLNLTGQFDAWPEEFSWEIVEVETGIIAASNSNYSTFAGETYFNETIQIASNGCYIMNVYDVYGDGLNGSISGSIDGNFELNSDDLCNPLFTYDGSYPYTQLSIPILVQTDVDYNNVFGCTDINACNYNQDATCDNGSCLFVGSACFDGDYTTYGDTMNENCECIGLVGFLSCNENLGVFEPVVNPNGYPQVIVLPNNSFPNLPQANYLQPYNIYISLNIASDDLFGSQGQCCNGFHLDEIYYVENDTEYPLSQLGINWSCINPDCTIDEENKLCVEFSGMPNQLGTFPLRFVFSQFYINSEITFNLDHFTLNIIDPCAGDHPICLVSVDPSNGNNMIVWEPQEVNYLTEYIIYKETSVLNEYEPIGSVSYGNEGIFIDENSNSSVQSSLYKIGALNTCSTEPNVSLHHKTVHLTSNLGINNEVNLIWSAYEGENVDSYLIYRGTSSDDLTLLATVSGSITSYTDLSPLPSSYYMIEVEGISCDPSREVLTSKSNIITIAELGVGNLNSQQLALYPNPANDYIMLTASEQLIGETYVIHDITGREVLRGKINSTNTRIALENQSSGSYLLRVGEKGLRFEK